MTETTSATLPLEAITVDPLLWPRQALDYERVELFAELLAEARDRVGTGGGWVDPLPPLEVIADGRGGYLLADGRHRYEARRRLGADFDLASAMVHHPNGQAPRACAYLFAVWRATCSAKPLTGAEKRAAIQRLAAEQPEFSDRAISRIVGVSHHTVAAHRAEVGNLPTQGNGRGSEASSRRRSDPIELLLRYGERIDAEDLEDRLSHELLARFPGNAHEWAAWWGNRFEAAHARLKKVSG